MKVGGHPVTPDGRYFVVRGRLWRMSHPALAEDARERLVRDLMAARREIARARRKGAGDVEARAHTDVETAKVGLGERGPVWWDDDAPDLNRRMAANSSSAAWFAALHG